MARGRRPKCRHCQQIYTPDRRNRGRQKYCAAPACRKASHDASNARWRNGTGKDYFKSEAHKQRTKAWRAQNPGYARGALSSRKKDSLISQNITRKEVKASINEEALKDSINVQLFAILGLIGQISGYVLKDDIESVYRRMILSGQRLSAQRGVIHDPKTAHLSRALAADSKAIQLDRPTTGP